MKKMLLSLALLMSVVGAIAQKQVQIGNLSCNRVLYADYYNRLQISVPGFKSSQLRLSCDYMRIIDEGNGIWILVPQPNVRQVTLKIDAEKNGNLVEIAQYQFEVRWIPYPKAYLVVGENRLSEVNQKLSVLKTSLLQKKCVLGVDYGDIPIIPDWEVVSFVLHIGKHTLSCKGNELSSEAIDFINQYKHYDVLRIENIKVQKPDGSFDRVAPLTVMMSNTTQR